MEFLKTLLGEELYNQVASKINEFNGNEENKEKIKLANLGSGGYVDKNKYSSLEADHNSKIAELEKANNLIAEMKKGTKGNEDLQKKVSDYETSIQALQNELIQTKKESALKVALLSEKATDIDYLTFKLNALGEIKLDENGQIEGWKEKVETLKSQYPNFFEGSQHKTYENGKLPETDGNNDTLTKSSILKQDYNARMKLYNENPEAYKEAMKK